MSSKAPVFQEHDFHTFKPYKDDSNNTCRQCTMAHMHPIHDVYTASEHRRKPHDFEGIRTQRSDMPLCLHCGQVENYIMHNGGSALLRGTPSTSLPDEPPTYGPHTFVHSDYPQNDTTLPCQACRYSFDAEHHIHIANVRIKAVNDYLELQRRDQPKPEPETSIALEAMGIVYGDREEAYDDPNVNFDKLAHMWTGHLLKKLGYAQRVTSQDVALMMVMLKLSREGFKPSRDNRVDAIGYILCEDRIVNAPDPDEEDDDYDAE